MIQLARLLLLAALMYGGAASGLVVAWARARAPLTIAEGLSQNIPTVVIGATVGLLLYAVIEPALKKSSDRD